MNIPVDFIERIAEGLPSVDTYAYDCIYHQFIYNGLYFELKFYKASDHGSKLWVYNPFWVQNVIYQRLPIRSKLMIN
ncbi:hypothetical protein GCM10023149_48570 [Mucilaginibacter gynuensis]|uniref:Uncharacterized protein n=1 Tax=Mucilaginibacter gynuensis TaxID=1302236 RepID=A0ABP8HFF2_9SPHI